MSHVSVEGFLDKAADDAVRFFFVTAHACVVPRYAETFRPDPAKALTVDTYYEGTVNAGEP